MESPFRLRQLRYFIAVADRGSVSAAAANLRIAQPSLSQQLIDLERAVGVPLLDRHPRGVSLTPSGRAFYKEIVTALRTIDRAARVAVRVSNAEDGELEVATVLSLAAGLLPAVFREYRIRHPRVALRLHEYSHADQLESAFLDGVGDIAFGPRPRVDRGNVISIAHEEFVVVLSRDDPAGDTDFITLSTLADRGWVLFAADHGLSEVVDRACAAAGFRPRASVRTSQVDAAARLAAAGLGPALLPANAIPPGLDALVRQCAQPVLRELTLYAREDASLLVRDFADVVAHVTQG